MQLKSIQIPEVMCYVALNFHGSLILQMGDFLCFAETNFYNGKDWFFLLVFGHWNCNLFNFL